MSMAVKNFAYTSRNDSGKIVKGKVEAPSEAAALAKIRGLGLQPVTVDESAAGTGLQREIKIPGFEKGVDLKALAIMSRQMATMISSGLSLLQGALDPESARPRTRSSPASCSRSPSTSRPVGSLSDAFAKHPVDFPPLMINMIRAGETGGFLEGALESLAVNYEKEAKLRSAIKSAMAYPVMVLVMSFVAVMLMLIFIVPVFKDMFEGLGSSAARADPGARHDLREHVRGSRRSSPCSSSSARSGGARTRTPIRCARVVDPLKLQAAGLRPAGAQDRDRPIHAQLRRT